MKIELAAQVHEFLRSCSPATRRRLRLALWKLENEKGDIKAMDRELNGYYRLRVQSHRVIFRFLVENDQRVIRCDFAEHRSVVYETFLNLLH